MASAGTASIDVTGDFSGFTKGVDEAGQGFLGKAGSWGKAAAALIGPALAIGAVVGLAEIGDQFDSAFDKIRITTGATGDQLQALQGSFKNVFQQVPASMDTVSEAIGTISQRLGLTGKPLEDLTKQFINLSRVTETDLTTNLDAATGVFNQFGITAEDQGAKLDELFRVTQLTGVSFGELTGALGQGGVQFRNAGLSFEESAGLLGLLAKNGLSASDVLPALSRSMATAAKDGKSAQEVFKGTFEAIRNAPDDTKAAGVALDVFGAKAGPKFAALIREGKLSYEDFAATIAAGGDTINQAAADTDDWREKLEIFKNKALVALEPIASAVFDSLGRGIDWLTVSIDDFSKSDAWESIKNGFHAAFEWIGQVGIPAVVVAFDAVKDWFKANWPTIQAVFQTAWDKIQLGFEWLIAHKAVLVGVFTALSLVLLGPLTTAIIAAVLAWQHFEGFREVVQKVVDWITQVAVPAIQQAWQWIKDNTQALVDYISVRWESIQTAINNVVTYLKVVVAVALAPIILIWQAAHEQILGIAMIVWDNIRLVIETAIRIIKDIVDVVIGLLSGDWGLAWDAIKDIPLAAFDYMKGVVQLGIDAIKLVIEGVLLILQAIWSTAWGAIQGVLAGAWDAIKSAVSTGIEAVATFLSELPGKAVAALAALGGLLADVAKSAMASMFLAFTDGLSDLLVFFADLPGTLISALGDVASLFASVGRKIIDAIADAIRGASGLIAGAIRDAALGALGSIGGVIGGAAAEIGSILGFDSGGVVPGSLGQPRFAVVHGGEVVLNRNQQAEALYAIVNGAPMTTGHGSAQPITVVNHGVAADPQTLAKITADELTWELRKRAA